MNDKSTLLTDAPVAYHLHLRAPGARLLEVVCRIRDPDPAGQRVSLPAWIPGSYLIRDFARHVVSLEASSAGEEVPLRKLDKSTWQAAPVAAELVLRAHVHADDLSVRHAHFDPCGAFFNGSSLFLRVHGQEELQHVVQLSPGADENTSSWQVATTMSRITGSAADYGAFVAEGYTELIDHPVMVGKLDRIEFEAEGVPHAVVLEGRHQADSKRLQRDLSRLCSWHIRFFGLPAPMATYLFLVRLTGGGVGGLEHRDSSALVCHRSHLPRHGQVGTGGGYRRFLALASHEYFHAWHVKRIRPSGLAEAQLSHEVYTRQLWIFEGITSYYGDLALLRSGLISAEEYLGLLARSLTAVYRSPGRRRQTLEEASFDAWIKFYRPDANSPNAQVSYYTKGVMVALALDLELRLRTDGRASLDDVMRVLWTMHGRESVPLPEGAFEELAAQVSGLDLAEFFRSSLRDTIDPPVGILLAQFGVRLQMHGGGGDEIAGEEDGKAHAWLGLRVQVEGGCARVSHVQTGSPAQHAGICTGDELVAIDGLRLAAGNLAGALDGVQPGQMLELHLFRRDELLKLGVEAGLTPRDSCRLSLDPEADSLALQRRNAWLEEVAS